LNLGLLPVRRYIKKQVALVFHTEEQESTKTSLATDFEHEKPQVSERPKIGAQVHTSNTMFYPPIPAAGRPVFTTQSSLALLLSNR
jgi:hypothetical protein